jgi:hypothetical protein
MNINKKRLKSDIIKLEGVVLWLMIMINLLEQGKMN